MPDDIEEDQAQWTRVERHFRKCADKIIKDAMYNARIAAVNYYYKKIKGQKMSKALGANEIYLRGVVPGERCGLAGEGHGSLEVVGKEMGVA